MAKQKDVWGFEEMEKAFKKMSEKYDSETDAMLHAFAQQAAKRMRQVAPVGPYKKSRKTAKLGKTYRNQKPRVFGDFNVSRVYTNAPHGHLVEFGHESYTVKGKVKTGKLNRYNATARRAMGVKQHKRVEGKYLFDKVWKEFEKRFPDEAKRTFEEITKGWEI